MKSAGILCLSPFLHIFAIEKSAGDDIPLEKAGALIDLGGKIKELIK